MDDKKRNVPYPRENDRLLELERHCPPRVRSLEGVAATLVRLQNVVAGGGSDDGQRKRGEQRKRRAETEEKEREIWGGQLRGWTLESIQGEQAESGWVGVRKAENLRPPSEFLQDLVVSHAGKHTRG